MNGDLQLDWLVVAYSCKAVILVYSAFKDRIMSIYFVFFHHQLISSVRASDVSHNYAELLNLEKALDILCRQIPIIC